MARKVKLDDVAIVHSGDKGDTANVAVIPLRYEDFDWLEPQLTVERVKALYGDMVVGAVKRYVLPGSKIVNFHLLQGNGGGSSRSLWVDRHAIARASLILELEVEAPAGWTPAKIDELGRVS